MLAGKNVSAFKNSHHPARKVIWRQNRRAVMLTPSLIVAVYVAECDLCAHLLLKPIIRVFIDPPGWRQRGYSMPARQTSPKRLRRRGGPLERLGSHKFERHKSTRNQQFYKRCEREFLPGRCRDVGHIGNLEKPRTLRRPSLQVFRRRGFLG